MSSHVQDETKIWVEMKKVQDENSSSTLSKDVTFNRDATRQDIIAALRSRFKLKEADLVFKLRNHRGSLVLISNKLRSNSKSVPYVLEVTRYHQNVEALPKATQISDPQLALKKTLQSFEERLSKLEEKVPNLKHDRNKKITQEMEEIEKTLAFLNQRLDESQKPKWQGMFKKNPLW